MRINDEMLNDMTAYGCKITLKNGTVVEVYPKEGSPYFEQRIPGTIDVSQYGGTSPIQKTASTTLFLSDGIIKVNTHISSQNTLYTNTYYIDMNEIAVIGLVR